MQHNAYFWITDPRKLKCMYVTVVKNDAYLFHEIKILCVIDLFHEIKDE